MRIGNLEVASPVVLAPMAGVTGAPFRDLCRSFGGGGLFVSEMVSARAIVEGNTKSLLRASFSSDESPRSLQLYAVNPRICADAIRRVVDEVGVQHIDLNLGCPAPKVTRAGGGAALTLRTTVVRDLVRAAVGAASRDQVPVTLKFRSGLSADVPTAQTVASIARDEGVAAVALHARWADQLYSGRADWAAVGELVAAVGGQTMAVLGNGDIWSAGDAAAMMRETGCDGVVVGRGCLGRPWFFRDIDDAFAGRPVAPPPSLRAVGMVMVRHASALCEWMGPDPGIRDFRKHTGWYLTGYPVGGALRRALASVSSLAELAAAVGEWGPDVELPLAARDLPRGHTNGPRPVSVPDAYRRALDSLARGNDTALASLAADPTPPDESALRGEAYAGG